MCTQNYRIFVCVRSPHKAQIIVDAYTQVARTEIYIHVFAKKVHVSTKDGSIACALMLYLCCADAAVARLLSLWVLLSDCAFCESIKQKLQAGWHTCHAHCESNAQAGRLQEYALVCTEQLSLHELPCKAAQGSICADTDVGA